MRSPFLLVLVALFVFYASGKGADAKAESKKLQGTWLITDGEQGGKKMDAKVLKAITLEIKGNKYIVTVGKAVDEGTVKLDLSGKTKAMTITGTKGPNKGKEIPAIYKISGDELVVCYNMGGKDRPKEFKTKPDTKLFLATYKRKKD
jgi:uncharacterized protein (TIGR03067 family)